MEESAKQNQEIQEIQDRVNKTLKDVMNDINELNKKGIKVKLSLGSRQIEEIEPPIEIIDFQLK